MATKTKVKPCASEHDFIAPKGETQDSEARCANCGAAPSSQETPAIRYVDPAVWFDTMVSLG